MRAGVVVSRRDVVELMVEWPDGNPRFNLVALCKMLGIDDPARVTVETDGVGNGLVTIYPSNPLAQVRAVTREDLVMDRHGYIVTGVYHNGRPVRKRLFDPATGSAQRFLMFGTTGAGKSKALQIELAAEKINGIVTWLADLKEGQSVPEALGNVDWPVTSPEGAILMLRSAVEVAKERMRRYSAAGRNSFMLGADPLFHVRIDEANRGLERGAPYRDEMTYLTKELGRTGRSVGVGGGLAAQASHLEELGGSDTLRAMFKSGGVTLLRSASSMMSQLVRDGLLSASEIVMPIPETLRPRVLRSQFDPHADDDEGAGTQGMGYYLSGPSPTTLMRHFRIGSIAPLAGLDPEILELYGPGEPARLEEASWEAAGPAYALRHDPAGFEALCQQLRESYEAKAVTPIDSGEAAGGRPRKARLEDRIIAALRQADDLTADEVLDIVNQDGGREVRLGSIRNTLGALADDEDSDVVRVGHGLYALAQ